MRTFHALACTAALLLFAPGLPAQSYGVWDVPCALGLSARFSAPHYHGVIYEDKEFLTQWRSIDQTPPLPSRNWYEPVGKSDVPSTDNNYVWYGAKVLVHCFVERNPYGVQQHAHPIAYAGSVKAFCTAPPRTDISDSDPYSAAYDPYAPGDTGSPEGECSDGNGGPGDDGDGDGGDSDLIPGPVTGDGGGGRSMCPDNAPAYWDIDCIDVFVEGIGWVEYWCGAVMVCG